MPLPIPQLDDRRFTELVTTLREQIPTYTQAWTDFNPSDPGITVLELWCWLAEMVLYRINQIPPRNYTNFFKLILDPPEPVTAEVTLTLFPQVSDIPLSIPAGTRFATRPLSPPQFPMGAEILFEHGEVIFETYQPIAIPVLALGSPPLLSPPAPTQLSFPVRSKVSVYNEALGISNGQAEQIVYVQKDVQKRPVLVDDMNVGGPGSYNPNPRIRVGNDVWEYVPDFLDSGPDATHFIVEQLTGGIRFGNGVQGQIPPAGAPIVAERYQILLGKEVRIGPDTLELRDIIPDLPDSDILAIHNTAAEGGAYIYPPEEAGSTGLALFHETFRAITTEDFAALASTQFNQAQESIWVPASPANRVARAVVVSGKNLAAPPPPPTGSFPEEPAAISIIILPAPQNPQEVLLRPSAELKGKVARFLDRRRLITTRLHVVGPDYVQVSLAITITREARTNAQQVSSAIEQRIRQFLHPLTGGEQGDGWSIGRAVYKSELFQLVESVTGVDHVNTIVMNGDPALNPIDLAEHQLPLIENITVTG